ncbi:Nif11 family protein [Anaerobiospirillum sp. NML120448]|uniref:Nif11 family protein n=1 Tax=Anaerobiospirillum sp. NML120448 TaxID=2932816 RepID=UPI001FF13B3C|nr:Nif11 family protein [Anaerobiospirillum sp. NML120448]MCK0514743.1 Nif11 family protein [Anaerobiospirillum sp. NML120448]
MSFEAITNFFDDLDNKEDLAKEFEAIAADENFKANLVALGAKFGYEFTLEELEKVAASAKRMQEGAAAQE